MTAKAFKTLAKVVLVMTKSAMMLAKTAARPAPATPRLTQFAGMVSFTNDWNELAGRAVFCPPRTEKTAAIARDASHGQDAANTKPKTKKLPASVRVRFNALIQSGGKAAAQDWELPDQIVEKNEGATWD